MMHLPSVIICLIILHGAEKDKEAMENAQRLVQSNAQYAQWNM